MKNKINPDAKAINLLFAQKQGKELNYQEKLTIKIYQEKLQKNNKKVLVDIKNGSLSIYAPIIPLNQNPDVVNALRLSLERKLAFVMEDVARNMYYEGSTHFNSISYPSDRFFTYNKQTNTWVGTGSKTQQFINVSDIVVE